MTRRWLVLGAGWLWTMVSSATAAPPAAAAPPLEDRVWIATRIYADVDTYFGHWKGVPDLDFDKEFRAYLKEVLATADRRAFDLASMALVARLKNGHSGFDDQWLRETQGQPLGFTVLPVDGKWVVTRSELSDLKVGEVLDRIDGRPFEEFFQEARRFISASDARWQRRALCEYPYLFPPSFTLTLEGGRTITIVRRGEFHWPGSESIRTEVGEKEGVPLIRIPSFARPEFETGAVEAVQRLRDAKALIIDVRGNHGGSTPEKLMEALMDRPYRWYAESTPMSVGAFRVQGSLARHAELLWYGDVLAPAKQPYRGEVYILADGGCFSACEDFVVSFKDNHRAVILGERTAGSSGQPFSEALASGMGIGLSTKREFFPDGSEFEGVGIAPDAEIKVPLEDLRAGRDPVLAEAVRRARPAPAGAAPKP